MLAGRWDETQYGDEMTNAGPWCLVARDKIAECRQWERSLSPTMKATRCGDLAAFTTRVSNSPNFVNETDLMGKDVWFWAFTGGNADIINELLQRGLPLDGLVSKVRYSRDDPKGSFTPGPARHATARCRIYRVRFETERTLRKLTVAG